MAVKVTEVSRTFSFGELRLPDPGVQMSPEEVKRFYAAQYPDLTNAEIEGPTLEAGREVYSFRRILGVKG